MNHVLALSRPLEGARRSAAQAKRRATALWRAYPRETLGLALFGLVAAAAVGTTAMSNVSLASRAQAAPPAPPPLIVRPIAPEQALKVNAEIPVTAGPNPVAAPFAFKGN